MNCRVETIDFDGYVEKSRDPGAFKQIFVDLLPAKTLIVPLIGRNSYRPLAVIRQDRCDRCQTSTFNGIFVK